MPFKHIIFDWDGTLVQTLNLWLAGYQAAFARRGISFSDRVIVDAFFTQHDLVPLRRPELDFLAIAKETRGFVASNIPSVVRYDSAVEVLDGLTTRGVSYGLLTSSPRATLMGGYQSS